MCAQLTMRTRRESGTSADAEEAEIARPSNLKDDNTDDDDPGPVSFHEALDLFRFARVFHPVHGLKFLERYSAQGGQQFGEWRATLSPRVLSSEVYDMLERDLPLLVAQLTRSQGQRLNPAELLVWWRQHGSLQVPGWNARVSSCCCGHHRQSWNAFSQCIWPRYPPTRCRRMRTRSSYARS